MLTTKDKILEARATNPYLTGATLGEMFGVSRQRVAQILKSVGLPTRVSEPDFVPKSKLAEYRVWAAMIQRCVNPRTPAWCHYGGRGIKVCEKWLYSFDAFYQDMGKRPSPLHSIDRKNNDGNYTPSNCRWATRQEQALNRRPHPWKEKAMGIREATIHWRNPKLSVKEAIDLMNGWAESTAYKILGKRDVPAGRRPNTR